MKFAKIVFLIAGIYGLLILSPMYFLENKIGRDTPPANHSSGIFLRISGSGSGLASAVSGAVDRSRAIPRHDPSVHS